MNKIVLDCSDPIKGCARCIFNQEVGCAAPKGLNDCYEHRGVWVVDWNGKEVKDDSCGQRG